MKRLLIAVAFLALALSAAAQWSPTNPGSGAPIYYTNSGGSLVGIGGFQSGTSATSALSIMDYSYNSAAGQRIAIGYSNGAYFSMGRNPNTGLVEFLTTNVYGEIYRGFTFDAKMTVNGSLTSTGQGVVAGPLVVGANVAPTSSVIEARAGQYTYPTAISVKTSDITDTQGSALFIGLGNYVTNTYSKLQAYTNGTNSVGQLSLNPLGGTVGIGTASPSSAYSLDVNGNAHFNGTVTGNNIQANYQDVAEWVPVNETLPPGTVVVLSNDRVHEVTASRRSYDTAVAGVVSGEPGVILGIAAASKAMIATTGRVRVKVDASRGAIHVGDLLVTSNRVGVAMKSEAVDMNGIKVHRPGTIIGKAIEPLASGDGEIMVLLSLQ